MPTCLRMIVRATLGGMMLGGIALAAVAPACAGNSPAQKTFATAEQAADALADAARRNDVRGLEAILGPGSARLVNSGDPASDAAGRQHFVAAFDAQHHITASGRERMVLTVGPEDWSLPVPMVETRGTWHFDAPAGLQAVLNRRIGRNEIAAIQFSIAYVDAQRDFFAHSQAAGGAGVFAQQLIGSPDRHDGLYWASPTGESNGPLAVLFNAAASAGYHVDLTQHMPLAYQGYLYRILKAQGPDAPGGTMNYLVNGQMRNGFALVAWPASYESTGIMTFLVNQDGIVFQKDLGRRTATVVARMERFDPDLSWARVDIVGK